MLINTESDSAVSPDAVVAARLSAAGLKAVADSFNTKLTYNRMRCNPADGAGSFPGMVRAEARIAYKFTVAHFCSPYFLIYRVTGLKPF